jgi:hypothetical protein
LGRPIMAIVKGISNQEWEEVELEHILATDGASVRE